MSKSNGPKRLRDINNTLLSHFHPYRMRRIFKIPNKAYYVLTFKKKPDITLVEKAERLRDELANMMLDSEQLIINKKSLSVKGTDYLYSYQIEAYKRANQTICFDNGIYTELIYRMGIEEAYYYLYRSCYDYSIRIDKGKSCEWDLISERLRIVNKRMLELVTQNQVDDPVAELVKIIKRESLRRHDKK